MKTHITPVQLFFLTFSYLLSGFFLFNITSYYAVTAQMQTVKKITHQGKKRLRR